MSIKLNRQCKLSTGNAVVKVASIANCLNIKFTTQVTRTEYVALFANIQAKNVYSNSISIKRAYKVTFIKGYKSTKDWLLKTIIKGFFRVTSPP